MGEKAMGCERAIQLRLDEDTMRLLDEQAYRRGYPTSALIKLIIAQWLVAQPPRPDAEAVQAVDD